MNDMRGLRLVVYGIAWAAVLLLGVVAGAETVREGIVDGEMGLPIHYIALNFVLRIAPVLLITFALALVIESVVDWSAGHSRALVRRLLYWTPRLALLGFAAFISLFALDVFGTGAGLWETLGALLMHLIPTAVLLVGAAIAWRAPQVGAIVLIAWAVWYMIAAGGQFNWLVYLTIAGLPFILGLLFFLDWRIPRDDQSGRQSPGTPLRSGIQKV